MRRYSGLIAILTLITVAFGASKVSALTYSSDVGVQFTFNPSLQINLSSPDLVIFNLSPGTTSDSNTIDVTILTNNITGYTLNATVGNNTTYNTRNLVHEVSGSSASFASINYGSSLASLSADNTWGYAYSTNSGSTWSSYDGLPLYNDEVNIATLKATTGPVATNSGDIINFKIAAKAATTQSSGEYNNVINFVAVANPEPQLEPISCSGANKICYSPNSLNIVEGTMGEQSANASTDVDLLASNFSQTGYGFAGWSDTYDYATNPNAKFYGPNETITTPADISNGLALYAVWVPSAGSMQSDASSVCSGLTTAPTNGTANLSSVSALTDQRDNQTYAIAKLADGKCWMIENLRLESRDTVGDNRFDSSIANQSLAQGYGTSTTYGNFSGLANAESANFYNSTTANSLYYSGTQSGDASINIGTTNYPGYRMPRYNNLNTQSRAQNSPNSNTFSDENTTGGMYSYGNYYTWHAAIADLTYNGTNNSSVTNTSLCPSGWHLPKGGNKSNEANNDFWSLVVTGINGGTNPANYEYYTGSPEGSDMSKAIRAYPNNFLYSGIFNASSAFYRGISGSYWSSTAYGNGESYHLNLNSSNVYPGTGNFNKGYGRSIRCTASAGI